MENYLIWINFLACKRRGWFGMREFRLKSVQKDLSIPIELRDFPSPSVQYPNPLL